VKALMRVLLTTMGALILVRWLVVTHATAGPFIPAPDQVVQTFINDLGTRPEQALEVLNHNLRLHTSAADLQRLDRALRRKYVAYQFQFGGSWRALSGGVLYTATIEAPGGRLLRPEFRLHRNPLTGLWQITSFSGLAQLAAPPPSQPVRQVLTSI
jgi:hypothetical protein